MRESNRSRSLLVVPSVALLLLAACSDQADSSHQACLREGGAEVCAERRNGAVSFSVSGLQPGSDLELATEEAGPESYSVGPNGEPAGSIGFVSVTPSSPLEVQVAATTANGAVLGGTLVVE